MLRTQVMLMRWLGRVNGRIHATRQIMYKKLCFSVVLLLGSLVSTGCYDRQELEQQAFVSVLGLDKAPGGLMDCTFVLAVPTNPAGGGSSKPPLAATTPITYRAHNITEAMVLANSSVERSLTFSHLTTVVFGSGLAQSGLMPHLEALARFREFRRTIYVGVAKDTARDVISANKPMLEQSVIREMDGIARVSDRNGVVYVRQLHHLFTSLETNHVDPVLPLFTLNQQIQQDPKGKSGVSGSAASFVAGQTARSGGNPVEWIGVALFRGDKMIGELDGQETSYLRILQGDIHSLKLAFPNAVPGLGTLGISLKKEHNPRYVVNLSNPLAIEVEVPLEADVLASGDSKDFANSAFRAQLEQQLDRQLAGEFSDLLDKLYHQYNVDVIPISRSVRSQFATEQAFANFPWESRLKNAKFHVTVDLHLRRFGIQTLPQSPKRI